MGEMLTKANVLRFLQGWICVVGVMAFGNTVSCFLDHSFLSKRLYTGAPEKANDLAARLFGTWTFLSALLRIFCAFCINNHAIYHLTFVSFVLALLHFLTEAFIYGTAPMTIGVLTPVIISSFSLVCMIVGYWCLFSDDDVESTDMPRRVEDIRLSAKSRGKRSKMD